MGFMRFGHNYDDLMLWWPGDDYPDPFDDKMDEMFDLLCDFPEPDYYLLGTCDETDIDHFWDTDNFCLPGVTSGGQKRFRNYQIEEKVGRRARIWRRNGGWRSGQSWKDHRCRRRQSKVVFVTLFP